MEILVIGYGSIGERHATILNQAGYAVSVVSSRNDIPLPSYTTVDAALASVNPVYVVISTATENHYRTLSQLLSRGYRRKVMIEKPLFGSLTDAVTIDPEVEIFVGYNLRFHPVLQYIKQNLHGRTAYSVNVYVGSYLPNWRKQRDYRSATSSANKDTGGVLRELSHELDYLMWLFGDWRGVNARGGHISDLEIRADDVFCLILDTQGCPFISIQMNYFDRIGKREIVINQHKQTIHADLIENRIKVNDRRIEFNGKRNDSYHSMHDAVIQNRAEDVCDYSSGLRVEQLIDACYKSLESGNQVRAG